jgi:hypothetical protein
MKAIVLCLVMTSFCFAQEPAPCQGNVCPAPAARVSTNSPNATVVISGLPRASGGGPDYYRPQPVRNFIRFFFVWGK